LEELKSDRASKQREKEEKRRDKAKEEASRLKNLEKS